MLFAIYNKPRLNFEKVCQAIGMSKKTGYTHRSRSKFPVPMNGCPLTADVRDVAVVLDEMREQASASSASLRVAT